MLVIHWFACNFHWIYGFACKLDEYSEIAYNVKDFNGNLMNLMDFNEIEGNSLQINGNVRIWMDLWGKSYNS